MELTRTHAVFSRIAMVLFLCRNESSQNVLKIYVEYLSKIGKIPAQRSTGGDTPLGPTSLVAAARGEAAATGLVAHWPVPSGGSLRRYFSYFPEIFSINFQDVPKTFISAQKQHHGNSTVNSISPG